MILLDKTDNQLVLKCPPRERDFALQVPALRFNAKLDAYTGPLDFRLVYIIQSVFESRGWGCSTAVEEWIYKETARLDELLKFKGSTNDHGILIEATNGDRLYPWQANDALLAAQLEAVIDDSVVGSGKGPKYLSTIRLLESQGHDVFPLLVVTRPMMLFPLAEEVEKWLPGKTYQVITKGWTPAARKKAIESEYDVLVVPWHLLQLHSRIARHGNEHLTPAQKVLKELNGRFKSIIFDEAHKALDRSNLTTRAMWALADEVRFKFFLTNTPMESSPDELWTLQRAAHPELFEGQSGRYVQRYCLMAPQFFGPDKCIGLNPANEAEWRFLWESMSISRGEEVLGDLPPKMYHDPYFTEMEGKQRSSYAAFDKTGLLKQKDLILSATNPLVKKLRLLQMACATPVLGTKSIKNKETGEVIDEVTIEKYTMPSCKVDFLLEVLDKYSEPLVVFMDDRKLLDLCAEQLAKADISFVEFKGGMKDRVREAGRHEFQSGNARVALCMFQCAAEGLTFTVAPRTLYLQRDDSSINSEQSEGRTRRIGQQAEVCEYLDHITKDTVEIKVHENYIAKIKARNLTLGRSTEVRQISA